MTPSLAKQKKKRSSRAGTVHGDAASAKQLPLPPPFLAPEGCAEDPTASPLTIFTIGHSNHDVETFLALLRQHQVATLIDVRSAPYSRYAPHFNRVDLDALLGGANVAYIWAGDTLGGRPGDPACYRDGIVRLGNVDYAAMATMSWYQEGVRQLTDAAARGRSVVMCSEEDPRRCHRHRIIEASLRAQGVTVQHIRKDGSLETIEPDEDELSAALSPQLALTGFDA